MDMRDDDVQKMHAMLGSLNAEIDALIKRAENAGAEVRNEIAEIRSKPDEADLKVGGETAGTLPRLSH